MDILMCKKRKIGLNCLKESSGQLCLVMFHQTLQAGASKGSNLLLSAGDILAVRGEPLRFNNFLNSARLPVARMRETEKKYTQVWDRG